MSVKHVMNVNVTDVTNVNFFYVNHENVNLYKFNFLQLRMRTNVD